ncbi:MULTISPECIES: outer membrane protein [unclassified Rhizobium]|uniref:outer membrane protein n=1 Tax=unclassified Rhizobium TaxID=2613769 RepID=UPI001ADA7F95|nr:MULTISPECIES: outer membrane protein [unclassified Rhizobium]MBO9099506.1 porin family protein [Rhizobium sp. L58/93]QXZ87012.1 porin family protein [Rhizobium sp. K1/93]QXZ92954.1 porin family protein [Rhizobium sp. K15/93]
MIRFDALAAAVVMTASAAGAAFGGDMPPEITVPEVSVKEAQGFYGRVDLGYAVQTSLHGARLRSYDASSGGYESERFDKSRFGGNDVSGGLGIGYQFNDLVRADVTGDLFRGDFSGRFSTASPCADGAGGAECTGKTSASFKAGSLLANAYVDLGTVAGFTPYVGGGVGATRVSWGDVRTTSAAASTSISGDADWRFTYALMAGVAYQLSPNVKLDLGYRYSHVAGGDMFGSSAATTAAGATGAMARQEIRVGLRVATW